MANFMDLPKPVREKIYRLHLVAEKQPVDFEAYIETCGYTEFHDRDDTDDHRLLFPRLYKGEKRKVPPLLHASRKIEKEASLIYFGENTFALSGPEDIRIWRRFAWPRHLRLVSKSLDIKCLTVVIDEEEKLRSFIAHHPIIRCGGRSGTGPQIGLQLLRLHGIDGFKELRNIQELKFVKSASAFASDRPEDIGSMPGGLLEVIRGEIVAASLANRRPEVRKKSKNYIQGSAGTVNYPPSFRFLDLPPEVRNIIYSMLLVFPGTTYPIAGKPISITSRPHFMNRSEKYRLNEPPAPRSALEILLVNHQVHDEALGLFYKNDLAFPTASRLQRFLTSLRGNGKRLEYLTSLTIFSEHGRLMETVRKYGRGLMEFERPHIFHRNHSQSALEGINKMQTTALLIRLLPNLRKLHFLYRSETMCAGVCHESTRFDFAFAGFMFDMRNISDIKVRDLDMEIQEDEFMLAHEATLRSHAFIGPSYLQKHERGLREFRGKKAALQHFNCGIRLAQKGVVVRELITDQEWELRYDWPKLEGFDCGWEKGCSCEPSGGEHREIEDVSHY